MTFSERRTQPRRHLRTYLPVYDEQSGECIGRLVEISPGGLRLNTEVALPHGRRLSICVRFRRMVSGKAELALSGRCVWCTPDPIDTERYASGVRLESLTGTTVQLISAVTEVYSLRLPHMKKKTGSVE